MRNIDTAFHRLMLTYPESKRLRLEVVTPGAFGYADPYAHLFFDAGGRWFAAWDASRDVDPARYFITAIQTGRMPRNVHEYNRSMIMAARGPVSLLDLRCHIEENLKFMLDKSVKVP